MYLWAVCLPAASFLVSAAPLEGEEFLWILVFQQMEMCVCALPCTCAVLYNYTVRGTEGFDVKRLISAPT